LGRDGAEAADGVSMVSGGLLAPAGGGEIGATCVVVTAFAEAGAEPGSGTIGAS
jgi:hypothetical protein